MEKIIIKYLEDQASEAEKEQLLEWLRQKENRAAFNRFRLDWKKGLEDDRFPGGGGESWNRLQAGLWQKEYERWQGTRKIQMIFRIAAIFFFVLSLGSLVLYYTDRPQPAAEIFTTVIAENGQISKIELPDGSMVWLNSGSKISYSNLFSAENRNVRLTGEAYFDVARDEALPLLVECGGLIVKVLGTRFNVNAHDPEGTIEVVLEQGAVDLVPAGNDDAFYSMKPGERTHINMMNSKFSAGMVNPGRYTSWTKGIINIYNLPMEEVIKRLEKRYNQQFELAPEVMDLRYTFTIQNESLEDILRLMEKITPVKAVQHNNSIRICSVKTKKRESGG